MPKLTVNEAAYGFTDVIKLTYNDLITIGNGGQKVIATIPAGGGVDRCVVYESVAIAGTTSLVIDVGTTLADPDEFIDALDVDAMTAPVANTGDLLTQAAGTTTIAGGALPVKLVQTDTDIVVEVTDAAIASATAGEIVIGLRIVDLGRFA
jgi:hypothetical protein